MRWLNTFVYLMLNNRISALEFHDELVLACETERRLPRADRRASLTYWPDHLPDWLAYASEKTQTNLARATSDQISRYDAVCDLVLQAPEADRRLLWLAGHSAAFRSRGPRWSKLCRVLGMDRRRAKREYLKAVVLLVQRLKHGAS